MDLRLVRTTRIARAGSALAGLAAIVGQFLGIGGLGSPAGAEDMIEPRPVVTIPMPDAGRASGPNIFGTIAIAIRPKPTSTRWAKLMFAKLDQPNLAHLVEGAQGLSPQQQAAFVQNAVNSWVRTSDTTENCSDSGYWPSGEETLVRRTANCFGIAIAKMEALRMLGVSTEDLYLTTGRFRAGADGQTIRESAALLVRIGEQYWLLPEQSHDLVETETAESQSTLYSPVLTYGVNTTWVHGRVIRAASLAP